MKTPKLLRKIQEFIDSDIKQQREHMKSVKEILKKLKKKQTSYKEKLALEKDVETRKQLQKELDIIFVQRKKGLKVYKELKEND